MTCPICSAELPKRGDRKKSDLKFCGDACRSIGYHRKRANKAIQRVIDFGFEYLSGEYTHHHSYLQVKNPRCGHEFEVRWSNLFTNPDYCPTCGDALRRKKTSERNKLGINPKSLAKWHARNQKSHEDAIARRDSPEWAEWQKYGYIVRSKSLMTYRKNIDIIDPDRIRSSQHHIDHIVPVSYCFKNKIPAEFCYSLENLTMATVLENCGRKDRLNDAAKALLVKWGYSNLITN
jgi:hypothetical protein